MAAPGIDPQTAAALARLKAMAAGQESGTPIDPQAAAIIAQMKGESQRAAPPSPPPVQAPPKQPPSSAYHRNPHVAVAPGGRVIDPATGQPFPPRGQPVENAQPGMLAGAAEVAGTVGETLAPIEHFTTPHLLHPALRILAVFANPVQQTVAEGAKGYRKGGAAGIIPGIEAGAGRIGASITQPDIARSDIGTNIGLQDPWLRAGVDFAGNTAIDWATGKFIQAPLVGGLIKGVGGTLQKSGAADITLPGIGKSLNQMAAEGANVRSVHQYFGAAVGKSAEIQREAEGFLQRANQRVKGLQDAGVNIQGVGEGSGQTVNRIDELVTHYIEAGTGPRAKYGSKAEVLLAGDQMAQNAEQARLIRDYITETAQDYSSSWERVGRVLEQVGYLKPGTVNRMRGTYAPGMYHATSHNPGDVEAWLDAANQIGGVNPKAMSAAEKLLANEQRGFSNASKSRTLKTYQQRVEHGGEFQVSPLFAKSIRQSSNIAARGEALSNIAADPELVASTYARGKLQLTGRQYGNAEGLYVGKRTKTAIDALVSPQGQNLGPVSGMLRFWRNSVVAGNLPMVQHHSKYVFALAEGRAAQEGVSFTVADIARAVKERAAYLGGQGASPAVDALSKNTRTFADPAGGLMQELGESLRSGLGVRSGAGKGFLRGGEKLANQTRKAIGTVEQSVKIALTRKLMTKYSPEEAARIAQETISGTGPPGRALSAVERMGVLPFVTAKARSAPKIAMIAATRPDILLRYSGVNEAGALGTALGPEARARQQLSENPQTAIPIPGLRDRYGRQIIAPESPFALSPVGGLLEAAGMGVLGPLGRLRDTMTNTRPTKEGPMPIVPPGSLPPWESVMKRLEYATAGGGTIGRGVTRLGQAARGETPYGGPLKEPETIGQAILGIAFGARTDVPETPEETAMRATQNVARAMPDMAFALDYLGKLERGEVEAHRSPWIERVRNPMQAAKQMKNAYKRLQELVTGREGSFAGQDRQQRIKNQIDWFYQTEHRFLELAGSQPTLKDLMEAAD